jgi:tetratricopeptide (TPR) repeat protein
MKSRLSYLLCLIMCAGLLTVFLYPQTSLAKTCEQWVAKVVSVQGTVEFQRAGESGWQRATLNQTLCPGDTIRAQRRSRANLALVNESVLRLNQRTTLTLGEYNKEEESSVVELIQGAGHFLSRKPRALEVQTPYAIAGVRGTEFYINVEDNQTFLSIFEGSVLASNKAGELLLASGQSAVAEKGKAPVLRVVVRPRDAVHWALYYPPVIYTRPGEPTPREDLGDPRYLAYRASLLIPVGRVDEAAKDLERALSLNPNYSDAYALQSIIAVVQNDKEKALTLAQKAVETGPNSATARIAQSYAQQASFNLEGAKASLEEAVKLEPENALAWARLAEIWSALGYLDKSLEAAQKAAALSPNLALTQTVLGFAYLTQVKTTDARVAFTKAIALDQADPLPRLGLGLAKIRDGDLKEGGRDIEIAASLDPNNSLVRSYLGKVYFEEKRTGLDLREYDIAKELDPNDPTPWFYSSLAKQTTNRPVEALHDIEKARELNDNRAVYRSKLALDSDLAARSSSVARIYNDLGFQARGLFEGWMSVNTDPSNYSAHRFLADTYAALPRRKIARVSELLISQLLQPTNITPIQPVLAESNLFLISTQGPSNLSFREFNPLFNRDRLALQATGLGGQNDNDSPDNDTWAGEGIVSGIYKNLSFSAGYSQYETDGFRINNDQEDKIGNVFVQAELTSRTSIQGEYRYRDIDRGDVTLRFPEDDIFPTLRWEEDRNSFRLGFRHSFTPSSNLIGNFSYNKTDNDLLDAVFLLDPSLTFFPLPPVLDVFSTLLDEKAYTGELQHLYRSQYVNTVAGVGYFSIDQDLLLNDDYYWPDLTPPSYLFSFPDPFKLDIEHFNVYLYSYINVLKNVTFTLGASGDFFEQKEEGTGNRNQDENQFNPKFGVIWNPVPNTTLRGAAFRTFKRTLVTDQTIEPTQVAGFNQFYDDPNATSSWVYGAAVDQKFSEKIYGGVEFNYRDQEVPYFNLNPFGTYDLAETDWEEYLGRAYLYWTPHKWFALSAEYLYEKFERKEPSEGLVDVDTYRVPLGVNFFHPSGLSVILKGTYFNQDGVFQREVYIGGPSESAKDSFWLVDAAINYRLPKRYGFITVGASNLFDEEFQYADADWDNPSIQPDRVIFAKVTLALP